MKNTQNKLPEIKQFRSSPYNLFGLMAFIFAIMFSFSSCNKEEDLNTAQGELVVNMTDSPGNYLNLDVEISRVEIMNENGDWFTLNENARTYNIISLTNGEQATIASQSELDAGIYTQLRLSFGANSNLGVAAGNSVLSYDMNVESQVDIPVSIEVNASNSSEILLDFHAAKSVVNNLGQYLLEPVITWIEDKKTGVQGSLESEAHAAVYLENRSHSFSTYTNAEGEFLIRDVEPGTYELKIYPDERGGFLEEVIMDGIVVTEGEITQTGEVRIQ